MTHDLKGKTLRWTFTDGPTAGKSFEHKFNPDGTLTFGMAQGGKPSDPVKYESATVGADTVAVSYLSASGFTLTSVLDFARHSVVAFASNEKSLMVQHGSFEEA